jgi:hypothetical protein
MHPEGENIMIAPEVSSALVHAANENLGRIRSEYRNGWYLLRADNGERKVIAAGSANTVLANSGWPIYGKNALLWRYASRHEVK